MASFLAVLGKFFGPIFKWVGLNVLVPAILEGAKKAIEAIKEWKKVKEENREIDQDHAQRSDDLANARTKEEARGAFEKLPIIIVMAMGLSSLSSCRTNAPVVADTEQCMTYFEYLEDGQIDLVNSACLCREYRFTSEYLGPVPGAPSTEHELAYCDRTVGWKPEPYGKVSAYWEKVRRAINRVNKKGKK